MTMANLRWTRWIATLGVALITAGCMESATTIGAEADGLVEVEPPTIGLLDWHTAPAGCEERLSAGVQLGWAEDAPDLVVAIDADAAILCVDTLPAVLDELDAMGVDAQSLERIRVRYEGTAFDGDVGRDDRRAATGAPQGDPSPQPSDVGVTSLIAAPAIDPTPQPSSPLPGRADEPEEGSGSSGGSAGGSGSSSSSTNGPEADPTPQPSGREQRERRHGTEGMPTGGPDPDVATGG